ncbi:hypothetical protein GOODEAATRI_027476 [Goodea atripinnis]|uniref:Uncharacterized protein n=1 Tax=Goodea atripinnis TaxID=208336 RepID=A0ABV0PHN3_9TELE
MEETKRNWVERLDIVTLSMRITPSAQGGLTPFEIIHGRPYYILDLDKELKDPQPDGMLADYMRKTLKSREIQSANNLPNDVFDTPQTSSDVKEGDWLFSQLPLLLGYIKYIVRR